MLHSRFCPEATYTAIKRKCILVSSQSFPHLCKNLWKMVFFGVRMQRNAVFMDTFARRRFIEHDLRPFFAFLQPFERTRSPGGKGESARIANDCQQYLGRNPVAGSSQSESAQLLYVVQAHRVRR